MNPRASRIVCAGEAMIQLSPRGEGWEVGYGGDTLNAAIHLARLGHRSAYLTALGLDPFAGKMCGEWAREGLDLSLVLTHSHRTTGLYAIETDTRGERHFFYWRGESAARELFSCIGIEDALQEASQADLFFFSLISLAILPEPGREKLLKLAAQVKQGGGKVAFDSNYRPRLWRDREEAAHWHARAVALADFGLPTVEDDRALDVGDYPDEIAARWIELGCAETVVKMGAEGCLLPDGQVMRPPTRLVPNDTSGAGDAFDAAYLATRLLGGTPEDAAIAGQGLAGWTVMHRGAIPPRGGASPYDAIASFMPD